MSNDNAVTGHNLDTSEGARAYVAEFFANQVRRHDFRAYITSRLAADFACALAKHLAAHQPVAQQPAELACVAETLANGAGLWMTCTGCHESNEGAPTGPYSTIMQCHLGNGCDECGGIGATWDITDYQQMADEMAASLAAQPSPAGQGDALSALVADWETRHGLTDAYRICAAELKTAIAARQPLGQEPVPFAVESKAFEAHAASRKLDLSQHPLHYLFLDRVADEARQAWKAALAFAPPAQAVDLVRARDSIQALLNWIDDWAETPEESGLDPIAERALELVTQIDAQVYACEPNSEPNRLTDQAQAVDLEQQQDAARWRAIAPHLQVEWDEDELLKRWTWIDFKGDALSVPTRSRESYASLNEAMDAVIDNQAVRHG